MGATLAKLGLIFSKGGGAKLLNGLFEIGQFMWTTGVGWGLLAIVAIVIFAAVFGD